MRLLRMVGAAGLWLVATVLLVLALVLSVTVVLLPLGLPLGLVAFRLYAIGFRLAVPRGKDVRKKIRKRVRKAVR